MALTTRTLADLPKGTVVTFDRSRARTRPGTGPDIYHAEMWTTEGAHYASGVRLPKPPTLHDLIDQATAEPDVWFLLQP